MPNNDALHAYKPLLPAVKTGQAHVAGRKGNRFLPVSKLPARMFREKRILIIYIKSNKSHYKTIVLLQEKSMAKERIKANVPIEAIAAQLRKDEKFLQGVGLYAVYQSSIETKSRRTAKHVQYEPQVHLQ